MSEELKKDICLNCKVTSNYNGTMKFHDIFGLQLDKLVEKYYSIKTDSTKQQKLCIECVNNLIELFDYEEYEKVMSASTCTINGESNATIDNVQIHSDHEVNSDYNFYTPADDAHNVSELKTDSANIYIIEIPNNDNAAPLTAEMHIDDLEIKEDDANGQIFYECPENPDTPTIQCVETETESLMQDDKQISCNNEDRFDDCQFIHSIEDGANHDTISDDANSTLIEEINTNIYVNEIDDDIDEIIYMDALEDEDNKKVQSATSADLLEPDNINSHSFDFIDINDYLDMVFTTKFEDLELKWCTQCKVCNVKFETFLELLAHDCLNQLTTEEHHLPCVIGNCTEQFTNKPFLARHMILKHYPELERLNIYGSCPECNWRFSNFLLYNKHSCCRHLKRKPGRRNTCKSCKLDFLSLKRYVFHMQFHMAKYRPKICFICEEVFSNPNELFEHVHYDHEDENAMACIKCDRFFSDETSFRRHLRTHESTSIFQCTYCHRNFDERHNLMSHLEIYHDYTGKQIQCDCCDKSFASNVSYRNHMKFHSPEAEVYGYVCAECGLVTAEGDILKKHAERDETSPCYEGTICEEILSVVYTCENCYMDFISIAQLHQHRLSSIHNDQEFRCVFCKKCFETYKQMRNHMKAHKEYENWLANFPICRLYICNIGNCEEAYPLWTSLYYHKKRPHSKDEQLEDFKCQFCHKQCPTKMSLAVHVARSHNNKNIKCSQCNNSYKDEQSLEEHISFMHTPIECKKCYKIIKNQRNYETHERIVHQNKQRYFCRVCDRGFYHKSEMEYHVKNIHSKVVFQCELCEFQTAYQKSLDIHVAKHNNQFNFTCNFCSKSFTRKHVLNSHIRRHHQKKEFVCCEKIENGCKAAYISFGELRRHAEKKHNYKFEGMPYKPRHRYLLLNSKTNSYKNKRKLPLNKKLSNKQRKRLAIENEEDALIEMAQANDDESDIATAATDADANYDINGDDDGEDEDEDENILEVYRSNLIDDNPESIVEYSSIADNDLDGNVQDEEDALTPDDCNTEAKEGNDNIENEHFDSIELILQDMDFENDNSNAAYTPAQYLDELSLEFK